MGRIEGEAAPAGGGVRCPDEGEATPAGGGVRCPDEGEATPAGGGVFCPDEGETLLKNQPWAARLMYLTTQRRSGISAASMCAKGSPLRAQRCAARRQRLCVRRPTCPRTWQVLRAQEDERVYAELQSKQRAAYGERNETLSSVYRAPAGLKPEDCQDYRRSKIALVLLARAAFAFVYTVMACLLPRVRLSRRKDCAST